MQNSQLLEKLIKEIESWQNGSQMKARFADNNIDFVQFVIEPEGRERLKSLLSNGDDEEDEDDTSKSDTSNPNTRKQTATGQSATSRASQSRK